MAVMNLANALQVHLAIVAGKFDTNGRTTGSSRNSLGPARFGGSSAWDREIAVRLTHLAETERGKWGTGAGQPGMELEVYARFRKLSRKRKTPSPGQ